MQKVSEHQTETAIIHRINLEPNCFAWKVPDQRQFRDGAYRKDPLQPAGQPDITAVIYGEIVFIEVKTEIGELSAKQIKFHKKVKECGASVYVCRNVRDVIKIINSLTK